MFFYIVIADGFVIKIYVCSYRKCLSMETVIVIILFLLMQDFVFIIDIFKYFVSIF
jgi:hypothetical protein